MNFRTALLTVAACAAVCFSQLSQAATVITTRSNIKSVMSVAPVTFDLGAGGQMRLRESPSRPSTGTTRIDTFSDGQLQMSGFFDIFTEISLDGGSNWSQTEGPFTMEFDTLAAMPVSCCTNFTFDTTIFFMNLSGMGGAFMIRESPTLASPGHVTVLKSACVDGSCDTQVDSFFDVFTELSLDGGTTWNPATGSTQMEVSSVPLPAGIWLFATGLMGLAGFARTRKFS